MEMILGNRPGATSRATVTLFRKATGPVARGVAPIDSGARRPKDMGVETVRDVGSPTVFNTGSNSNSPMITACNPNEVIVVQLRRVRWAHEVSSKLSANIVSSA